MTPINCGSCRACCMKDRIALEPGDNPDSFRWHWEHGRDGQTERVLDRKPNGQCTYLRADGCSIHETAPVLCKRFDCRELYQATPSERRTVRIHQNPTMRDVYAAGAARLAQLSRN